MEDEIRQALLELNKKGVVFMEDRTDPATWLNFAKKYNLPTDNLDAMQQVYEIDLLKRIKKHITHCPACITNNYQLSKF